jgi:predicted  nucleic acid-binding Zn-ribbon protein
MAGTALVVILAGALGLWYVWPSPRLRTELQDAQANVLRLGAQVDELRTAKERVEGQLASERARVTATEADLRREKEMNARLHVLMSAGKK